VANLAKRFKETLCYLAAELNLDIQVAHYPPGCSKYNPIEHRLFCHISRALEAVVLKNYREVFLRASLVPCAPPFSFKLAMRFRGTI